VKSAPVAQLVEQLPCKQSVEGSNPSGGILMDITANRCCQASGIDCLGLDAAGIPHNFYFTCLFATDVKPDWPARIVDSIWCFLALSALCDYVPQWYRRQYGGTTCADS
jgi:hypothetical protein